MGGIIGGGSKTVATPIVSTPTVMPVEDDASAKEAKKRSLAQQASRSGRQATIMTDQSSEKLGG